MDIGLYSYGVICLTLVAVIMAAISRNKGTEYVSLALIISLTGALLCGQVLQSYEFMVAALGGALLITRRWDNDIAHAINVLYGVRVILVVIEHYGAVTIFQYQEINSWFVIVQAALVIWGSCRHGGIGSLKGGLDRAGGVFRVAGDLSKRLNPKIQKHTN